MPEHRTWETCDKAGVPDKLSMAPYTSAWPCRRAGDAKPTTLFRHLKPFRSFACVGIQELQEKRLDVAQQIKEEEGERLKLQQDLAILTERLSHIHASLQRKACPLHCGPFTSSLIWRQFALERSSACVQYAHIPGLLAF